MKKSLTLAIVLVLCLQQVASAAETKGAVAGASTAAPTAEAATTPTKPVETEKPLTVTEKKVKAEADLRAVHTQFALFVTRTQATIDRLSQKGIDTTTAQEKLTGATTALTDAKTSLDTFNKILVSDDMTDEQVARTDLKSTLIKIQDNLGLARTNIIDSLSALKAAVATSMGIAQ